MIKVFFTQTEHSSEYTLKMLSKMTPNRSGKWKNLIGTTNIDEADFIVVIDYTVQKIPKNKPVIYLGAHPTVCKGYQNYDNKEAFAKFDCRNTVGFIEWWLKDDYDALMAMKLPKKTKDLSCIISNQRVYDYHRKRIEFLKEFCEKFPDRIDIYGRIKPKKEEGVILKSFKGVVGKDTNVSNYLNSYWYGKKNALESYRYSLEFDMGNSPEMGNDCFYYFSERLVDSLLMWCMPIYYGGTQIHKFLPINSFRYLNLFKDTPEYVIKIINSNFREDHLKDIEKARYLILNELQIWARVWRAINDNKHF